MGITKQHTMPVWQGKNISTGSRNAEEAIERQGYTNNNKQGCRYKDMYCQFEKIDRGHDDTFIQFNPDHLDAILCLKRNGVFRNCASKDNDNIWTLL